MYSLNTEHTEDGIKVTIPQIPTDEDSGKQFAFIRYIPIRQQKANKRWRIELDGWFADPAFEGLTFRDLDAAQYQVLVAYHEHKANS